MIVEEIDELRAQLDAAKRECDLLRRDNARLEASLYFKEINSGDRSVPKINLKKEDSEISTQEKLTFFGGLFRGREDVFALRWESKKGTAGYSPACAHEWDPAFCNKPKTKCGECVNRTLLPLTESVIYDHLAGKHTVGVYPLLKDDTCWFLAADFDKKSWMEDAISVLKTCGELEIPVTLERSRSGHGGHVWIFFNEPLPALLARQMGTVILTLSMKKRYGMGLDSYDRLFPNQDTLTKRGFGNLIALPLQRKARRQKNTVFLDPITLLPFEDQWASLMALRKMGKEDTERIVEEATKKKWAIGIRQCSTDEYSSDDPWTLQSSKKVSQREFLDQLPQNARIVRSNLTYIQKEELPVALQDQLLRLAAFQNPAFYEAQKMRMSVYGKPRIISCAVDFEKYIGLPRGSYEETRGILEELGIAPCISDERFAGRHIEVSFKGDLRESQQEAVKATLAHDIGILCAETAFGKTTIACRIIAERQINTLILMHRMQLVDQWKKQLSKFLDLPDSLIGTIGGGKKNPTGFIDIGTFQSLYHKGEVDEIVGDYGQVIVDECHRVGAFSFEQVLKQAKAQYVLGLTATLIRKDGHHPIIIMQCGPARFRTKPKNEAKSRPFNHLVITRRTNFTVSDEKEKLSFHEIYTELIENEERNNLLMQDVIAACRGKRSPLLLTERINHLQFLTDELKDEIQNVIVLRGGMGKKQRQEVTKQLDTIPDAEERLVISTGRYIGEGFDDPKLDTLFLATPVSWKGTLQQYVGRLHRLYEGKKEVIVYDYVDSNVAALRRMYEKRKKGYKAMGYHID